MSKSQDTTFGIRATPSTPWMSSSTHERVGAKLALIILAVCVAYWPSLRGGFIMDDDLLLTSNPSIAAPDGLYSIWFTTDECEYYPISYSSFWLEWRLWGMNPLGYHITNLILHIATVLLIWLVLRKLSIPGAYLAALLFAVHPVNVESVAWIAQRRSTLAILFSILSILCYLRAEEGREARDQGRTNARNEKRRRGVKNTHRSWGWRNWYWLSLLGFLLAMLSKGSVAILPVLLLGLMWWQRRRIDFAALMRIAPFLLIAIALSLVNMWFNLRGFDEPIRSASVAERCAGAGAAVWFYLSKALAPLNLTFIYPQWSIDTRNILWWMPVGAAVIATTVLIWKRESGWDRPLLAAWLFFGVALSPILGFFDIGAMQYSLVADHYQHIALIGVVALVSASITWCQRQPGGFPWTTSMAVVLVGTLTLLTWRQNGLYESPLALYEATLGKNPESWLVHNNLGFELANSGRAEEAIRHYHQALRLKPNYVEALDNLGVELMKSGQVEKAIQLYEQALRINPNHFATHNNLGVALINRGRIQEGIEQYEQALQLRPDYAPANINLGVALGNEGKVQEAIAHYTMAIRLNPDSPEAHFNLGNVLFKTNQLSEAIEAYRRALDLRPDYAEAHTNLAIALASAGKPLEAIEHYKRAVQLDPNSLVAQNNLGNALARADRPQEAVAHLEAAVRLKPDSGSIHNNLGVTLADLGRFPEAIEQFQQAIQLDAANAQAYFNLAKANGKLNRAAEAIAAAQTALELAHSHGRSAVAKQIDDWLTRYRAEQTSTSRPAGSVPSVP